MEVRGQIHAPGRFDSMVTNPGTFFLIKTTDALIS